MSNAIKDLQDFEDDIHNMDPEKPGLDEETRARRRILAEMRAMTPEQRFQIAVRAGIFTADGQWTAPYLNDEPSLYRPMK
jgi:hypothetical protein